MSKLSEQLTGLSACKEAVEWAEGYETLAEAWAVCERGDWMLWLCYRMRVAGWPTRKEIMLAACDCAELALPIYEARHPNDDRIRHCLEVTREWDEWVHGDELDEDLERARRTVAYASYAAVADYDSTDSADSADYAAAASYAATDPIETSPADAASYAAHAIATAYATATYAATDAYASYAAVYATALKQCADICRTRLKPGKL